MKTLYALGLFLLVALMVPMPRTTVQGATPEPGYIIGTVGFPGFDTTSLSMTAVGGGNTILETTYDSSTYQLATAGGNSNYSVSASCGLSGGNNKALTVFFSQRSFPVASGETVTNNYVFTPGIVRFQVNLSGDPTLSSAVAGSWATRTVDEGEKTATYSTGTPSETARSYSWDLPVVPNQQIELTAKINVFSASGMKTYTFSKTALAPYTLSPMDVAPGEVVLVPLEINFVEGDTPPPSSLNKGTLAGSVYLLDAPPIDRHTFNGRTILTNPGTYSRDQTFAAHQYSLSAAVPTTFFKDANIDSNLRWPFIHGDSNNNKVTLYPGTTSYLDLERAGGLLAGRINLYGTLANEDLTAITFNFNGVGNVYDAVAKKKTYRENYYGSAVLTRNAAGANVKRTSERDYQLFLTTGDWDMTSVTLSRQLSSPTRTSSVTFRDHTTQYDGQTYLGTPVHIKPGTNHKDFEYCFGSAIFRFWDTQGLGLSNPQVYGKGTRQTNGVVDLTVSSISATSTQSGVTRADVELFGPAGNYSTTTLRVTTNGTVTNFPARNFNLACNTTQIYDIPGPTLTVTSPRAETVTNAQSLAVSGQAFAGSAVAVTVNDQTASLTPLNGGVAFSHELPLDDGENLITVTATETNGAQATDQLIVLADRWQPTVAITSIADGDILFSMDSDIPVHVEATDLGYGYTLSVSLNGTMIHSATATGDGTGTTSLNYYGTLDFLPIGEHVITATVNDRAGNSASSSSRITVIVYQPPPVLQGLNDQILEAASTEGTIAAFEVTATSTCNPDQTPEVLPAPLLTPQGNSISAANSASKTFHWEPVSVADGHPAQYLVEVSDTLDFATIRYGSPWQTATTWTQSLPLGTWYWRVLARDSVHTDMQSSPATGNSFAILHDGSPTTSSFAVQNLASCTLSGGVYPNAGNDIYAGPFDGEDVDRSFLMFDTSSLGAGASIVSAKLKLYHHNNTYVSSPSVTEVRESTWELPGSYDGYIGDLLASINIPTGPPLGLVSLPIRADYVQTTSITKFALKATDEDFEALYNSDPGYSRANSSLEVTYSKTLDTWAAPILNPQQNDFSHGDSIAKTFQWSELAAADGHPVEYLVEVSSAWDFSTVDFNSSWQTQTTWSQLLPLGTWYWRVTARDAGHPALMSDTAASSLSILYQAAPALGDEVSVTCNPESGATFPLGVTTVICSARDACNLTAEDRFTITVRDSVPPVLTLPADLTVEATSAVGATVDFLAEAADLIDPWPVVDCLPSSGFSFPVGETTVSCTASDVSGNTSSGAFKVTVNDSLPPVLVAPADVTVEASGMQTPVEIGQATASHHLEVMISNDAPATFPVGVATVTWTAVDSAGKSSSALQTVTVTDQTAPVLAGLTDQTFEATSAAGAEATFIVTASDLVDPAPVVTCSTVSGATLPLGVTTTTCMATDANGNSSTGSFTITVQDTTPPVLDVPADLTVLLNTSFSAQAVQDFLNGATADDLVDTTVTVTARVADVAAGTEADLFRSVGKKLVNFTAGDAAGNRTTRTANIAVIYGCGDAFMEPVGLLKPFRQGSTIPVKIGFCDTSGDSVTTAVVSLSLYAVSNDVPAEEPLDIESTSGADTGNYFRVSDDQYLYNLNTKTLAVGTYQIRAVLDDGTSRTVPLALK